VEYTEDEFRSGNCKGIVRCNYDGTVAWLCEEGDCIKKYYDAGEQRQREQLPTREDYYADIEYEENEKGMPRYLRQIRGIRPTKDIPFEEWYNNMIGHQQFMRNFVESIKKEDKRETRERMKQNKADAKLRRTVTPRAILEDNLREIGCMCTAEELRQNKFCNTCHLLARVKEYLLRLFKDTAEGMK
jgi:hypothetical protein